MCFRVYMFRFKSSINIFITILTIVVRYHLNTDKNISKKANYINDFITNEYVYNNIKINETRNIVENTLEECKEKCGGNYRRSVKVECVATFLDKINNETKKITTERYNIIGELIKIMQSSKGMIKLIRIIQVKIIIESRIHNNVSLDFRLEFEINPILWKKYFMRIVNNRRQRFIHN